MRQYFDWRPLINIIVTSGTPLAPVLTMIDSGLLVSDTNCGDNLTNKLIKQKLAKL